MIILEILEFTLKSNDKFIIIASDGIWEFISNEKAVEIVAPYYFKKNPSDACNELLNTATKLWMTVINKKLYLILLIL